MEVISGYGITVQLIGEITVCGVCVCVCVCHTAPLGELVRLVSYVCPRALKASLSLWACPCGWASSLLWTCPPPVSRPRVSFTFLWS